MKIDTSIYFIDEWNSSRWNGIGTFRDTLVPLLSELFAKVCLVSLNHCSASFSAEERGDGKVFRIPFLPGGWRENGADIAAMLARSEPDSKKNVFIINHSPCAEFIREMKNKFPCSRFIFIVHDQGWCSMLMGDSSLLREIICDGSVPDIVSEQTARIVRKCCEDEKDIYDLADAVVTLCRGAYEVMAQVYKVPADKIFMIPNAFTGFHPSLEEKSAVRKKLGVADDEILLMFVGRAERHKGMPAILRLAKEARAEFSRCRCVIPGSVGKIAVYESLLSEAASGVILTGHLSKSAICHWYAAADIGVLCSYTEQCSFAALEMMASDMTLVSSDGHGLADMFHSGNAFIAQMRPVNDDTEYIRRLLEAVKSAVDAPPGLKNKMKNAHKEALDSVFSPSNMKMAYKNLICALM